MIENYYSVADVAAKWNMPEDFVRGMYHSTPGVLRIKSRKHGIMLRVPQHIVDLGPLESTPEPVAPPKKYKPSRESISARHNRRRGRQLAAVGSFTLSDWRLILAKFDHKCAGCGKSDVRLTMDHIVPLCRGGSNFPDNLQPLCKPCNCRKGSRTMFEWTKGVERGK